MLDTKLKNYKKPYFINIIAIIILIITSTIIISTYPKIKNICSRGISSPYENEGLLTGMYQGNFVLYKDVLEREQGENLSYGTAYLKSNKTDNYDKVINEINSELGSWDEYLNEALKNLDYLVLDKEENIIRTNTKNDLTILLNENLKNDDIKALENKYDFYIIIQFNNDGLLTIKKVYGIDEFEIKKIFSNFNFKSYFNYSNDIQFNTIKNTIFVYGIPKELEYKDNISLIRGCAANLEWEKLVSISKIILSFILAIALLIPYKKGKDVFGIKIFFKIPFEINLFILGWAGVISVFYSSAIILQTLQGTLCRGWMISEISSEFDWFLRIIVNIIVWSLIIYFIFIDCMLLKHILNIGIVKYFKENLFIIKAFKVLKNRINNFIEGIENIDLTDKSNKFIIKILGVNFIILLVSCSMWIFGIVPCIIYTLILFFIFRKYLDNIKRKYGVLLGAANKIAEGNLDIEINEDLGFFNPFKQQIEKIQQGFKKAVDEEVKSQKMKTDLISNVSHDLKTPLTSIITYIDLLKNKNIAEEDRQSYINTLDKKSQRLKFLIEDLFEVSKATSGNINLNLVNVDIVELMRQTEIELEDKIKKSELIFRNNFPENKVILNLDSQKTFRIFENLINNIIKYAMKNSRVYIDILEKEDSVEIILKNMSSVEIDFNAKDISERFVRGDKSRNTDGSGLGLAIAKSFVEIQGGSFDINVDGDLFKVIIEFKK
ncbi:sensor histidine kinase [Clostridium sp. CTA-5]